MKKRNAICGRILDDQTMNRLTMLPWTALVAIHVVFGHLCARSQVNGSDYVAGYVKAARDLPRDRLLFSFILVLGMPFTVWWLAVPIYAFYPSIFEGLGLEIQNQLLGWIGMAATFFAGVIHVWSHMVLGRYYAQGLPKIRQGHKLVTTGPYRYVRHPIYVSAILYFVATFLLAANWFFLMIFLTLIPGLYVFAKREEKVLIDHFGSEYSDYMKRSWMFIPMIF